jgi:hypothetical protein
MLKILQFYVSDFWIWAGITFGLCLIVSYILVAVGIWIEVSRNGR